jgi:hypothetical protein
MATVIETKDVPRENLFMVGIVAEKTERDLFVIAAPRKPFVINRQEACNLIGHLVSKADFTVDDIEQSITMWKPEYNLFEIEGDDLRVMVHPAVNARVFHSSQTDFERRALVIAAKQGLYLFGMEEGKLLCAALVHVMGLQPRELEAGVIAIFDHARNPSGEGQSEEDVRRARS